MHRMPKILIVSLGLLALTLCGCAPKTARLYRDFDFDWKFIKADPAGAQAVEFDDSTWRNVNIPHDWSIEGPYSDQWASGTGYLPGGIGWYRKTFRLDSALQSKRIAIEFDGIYNNSEVWLNGQSLGKRPFGYISFQYDLTPHLRFGSIDNVLAVRVDHSEYADSRWYTGSGIYRHTRLCITDPLHIDYCGTFITTPAASEQLAAVQVQTALTNSSTADQTLTLTLTIEDPDRRIVALAKAEQSLAAGQSRILSRELSVKNPVLWSPDNPAMYTLHSTVAVNGRTIDNTTTPFGIRTFRFDPDEGFFLNGVNMKIKGVCLHHDAGCVGAAVPEKMWIRRLAAMKEIGANAIRCSHNPPAPEFLDLCDRMGFLVMDEAFDEFTPGKNKWVAGWNKGTPSRAGYNEVFEEWAVRDIQDMVRRDRNHPSIILWSIGNEIDYANDPFSHPVLGNDYRPGNPPASDLTRYGTRLVEAVKALDTTRPVTAALANAPMSNAVGFGDILDVVGYNYQEQRYPEDHTTYPKRCLLGSENSISLNAWEAVVNNDYISGQFLWTGIDYLGEATAWPVKHWDRSLYDLCGFKKPQGWFRQSLWAAEPMVYIACQEMPEPGQPRFGRPVQPHWNWPGKTVRVICYTNCDEVELFLNDVSLGTKPYSEARQRALSWQVPFQPGTLKAVGRKNGSPVSEYSLQTPGKPAAVELVCDADTLAADGKDICHVEFRIVDAAGIRIPDAENLVTFTLSGPAAIIGLDNANPASHEPHQGTMRKAFNGRGLAVIQSLPKKGTATLRAEAEGLAPCTITIKIK